MEVPQVTWHGCSQCGGPKEFSPHRLHHVTWGGMEVLKLLAISQRILTLLTLLFLLLQYKGVFFLVTEIKYATHRKTSKYAMKQNWKDVILIIIIILFKDNAVKFCKYVFVIGCITNYPKTYQLKRATIIINSLWASGTWIRLSWIFPFMFFYKVAVSF